MNAQTRPPSNSEASINEAIVRRAIAWRIRLDSGAASTEDVSACEQWRQSDAQHERAWQRLELMEAPLKQAAQQAPKLARKTLVLNHGPNVSRRQALRTLGGTALGVAGVSMLAQQRGLFERIEADYSSAGQSRQYQLSDNSQLWLNRYSAVKVDFTSDKRAIELSRGEIHIASAKDPRPLQIDLPQAQLSSLDASFTVRHGKDFSLLQVAKGQLSLRHKQSQQLSRLLAGQALKLDALGIQSLDNQRFDYSSWIDGVLAVREIPLKDLLDELSRYRSGFLRCDPTLNNFRVSGVFQLHDTDTILEAIARTSGAKLRYITPWWVNIAPQQSA